MTESYRPAAAPRERERLHGDEPGGARACFITEGERDELCQRLEAERMLVVWIDPIAASARGRLADVIDEAIERELDARGAAPPGIGAASDPDAALSDQLFRARRVGATGLVLALGPLRAATSARGAIEPEDSATLRFWSGAMTDRPVRVLLDASDRTTGAYGDPTALMAVLEDVDLGEEEPACDDVIEPTPTEAIAVAAPPAPAPDVPEISLAPRHTSGAAVAVADEEWRTWTLSLAAARGPQPLAAFERLFARDYMPLTNAIAAGLDDPRAIHAHDEFRRTFSRAYSEACPTFAVTGKRPKMVLDAPEVAARIARLHGARTTQILLVDAMRFDVGARVRDNVRCALGSRASLTDEVVLWSTLPTTTTRQLETLQRGIDALRAAPVESERESDPLRGRTAEVIRRVKVGARDLYKLDVIEARVRELGTQALLALPEVADAAADAIVRYAQTLQPRTLLFVFGDHGFTFDRDGTARQGGASPEEVLVPSFALLIGDVH